MQADVVEAAERVVIAQDDDGIVADGGGEEAAVLAHLLRASDELPRVREDAFPLELEIDGIVVEPRRNRGRALDVRIEGEDERHRAKLRTGGGDVRMRGTCAGILISHSPAPLAPRQQGLNATPCTPPVSSARSHSA